MKLLLTFGATVLLPMHLRVASRLSRVAVERAFGSGDLRGPRMQIACDAAAAVMVLLVATILSVYKPWGTIELAGAAVSRRSAWGRYVLVALAILVLLAVVVHLTGVSFRIH